MLRRRKKPPKVQRHETPGPRPSGRRRARPDAPVPPALKVRPDAGRDVVLVTGFQPFGGEGLNPSWEVCKRLPAKVGELRVETCRIPCEFRRAIEVVAEAIERLQPAMVLCLGQAGGRSHLSVERVAINVDDARVADNSGASPVDETIAVNGPAAYFSTLPIKAMAVAMRGAGVPALVSNSAGTYVCNHLMYGVLHFLAASNTPARAGFIHLPYAEEQVLDKPGTASLALATMVKGVEAAIAAAATHPQDIKVSEGATD